MTDGARPLAGKTAVVTGASRGLGRQVAVDLAELGALVAINYATNAAAAAETLARVEAAGGQGFVVQGVLGSFESAEQLAATLDEEFIARTGSNGIDVLINNAGGGVLANLEQTTPEILEKTVADNFTGPFYVTKVLLPRIRDNGRIVNLSSQAAASALSEYIVYSMCKAAVNTFTVAVARDLRARGITVNSIMPGLIATDSNTDIRANPELVEFFTSKTLAGRIGQPSDISGTVLALVSANMSFVTGQVIEVSGGLSL